MEKLVFENADGNVIRTMHWDGQMASLVQRHDSRRVVVVHDLQALVDDGVDYTLLATLQREKMQGKGMNVPAFGNLKIVTVVENTHQDVAAKDKHETHWKLQLAVVVFMVLFMVFLMMVPKPAPKEAAVEEEVPEQIEVKIVRAVPVSPESTQTPVDPTMAKPTKAQNVKRMGALAVLGRMDAVNPGGGVNLGAAVTSRGPGMGGGTGGSGGVQTSLYGKGIIGAPVGPGNNLQGGGGYGTKGKGGGQDGYGQMTLVGSVGSGSIPLGNEAEVESGLDRDLIGDVIRKNMGQVRFCYEQGLQSDPKLAGRIGVNFVIGGNGLVKTASIGSTTMNSSVVENCIVSRLKGWKFPLPQGGVDVRVAYPFLLRRVGQG